MEGESFSHPFGAKSLHTPNILQLVVTVCCSVEPSLVSLYIESGTTVGAEEENGIIAPGLL